MRNIYFDDLRKNHLFDYKDVDLLVIDDITRLQLADYENTTLAFVLAVFCVEGRLQTTVDGREYRLNPGDFFIYTPRWLIGEILISPNAKVKVIAFAERAIDRSLYLNKYAWKTVDYVKSNPLFTLSEQERQVFIHYYQLLMFKKQSTRGSFHSDVVRLLFQAFIFEFLMLVDRRRIDIPKHDSIAEEEDSLVRQPVLIYRRFMRLLAESGGRTRSVSFFANQLNVTPKYLSACVKEECGNTPLTLIHETTISIIRQQLRYSNKSIKEICAELDFPTLSFFGKFVREHLGMSPTEYRQKHLEEG